MPSTSRQLKSVKKTMVKSESDSSGSNNCYKFTIDLDNTNATGDTSPSCRSDTASTSVAPSILTNLSAANSSQIKVRPNGNNGFVYSCDRSSSLHFIRYYSRKLGAAAFTQESTTKYNPRMARKHVAKDRTPREQELRDKNTIDARISRQRKIRKTKTMLYYEREEDNEHTQLQKLKATMMVYLKKLNQELEEDDDTICEENIIEHEIV